MNRWLPAMAVRMSHAIRGWCGLCSYRAGWMRRTAWSISSAAMALRAPPPTLWTTASPSSPVTCGTQPCGTHACSQRRHGGADACNEWQPPSATAGPQGQPCCNQQHEVVDWAMLGAVAAAINQALHADCLPACRGAGTDANVCIEMHGEKGSVGKTRLETSANNFERAQTDIFVVKGTDIGAVQRIVMTTDGGGMGADWHLQHVRHAAAADGVIIASPACIMHIAPTRPAALCIT